jgi:hypothetical protein
MIYRGRFRGGVIVLEPGVRLPEGTEVVVQPVEVEIAGTRPSSPRVMRNGVPVFPRSTNELRPGLDLVNQLRDETL